MPQNFLDRFATYFNSVARSLQLEAEAAAAFSNSSDTGSAREGAYLKFLRDHAPSKCNVFLGGQLFDCHGHESKQLDILITTDTTPRYNFLDHGLTKAFSPVEGTLGVISVKSTLDKAELHKALYEFASIPPTEPLGNRAGMLRILDYEDWPYKVLYAHAGISGDSILSHLNDFYATNSEIPKSRTPNMIHVCGKYMVVRARAGATSTGRQGDRTILKDGSFELFETKPDLQALLWVVKALQSNAQSSNHILFDYTPLLQNALARAFSTSS